MLCALVLLTIIPLLHAQQKAPCSVQEYDVCPSDVLPPPADIINATQQTTQIFNGPSLRSTFLIVGDCRVEFFTDASCSANRRVVNSTAGTPARVAATGPCQIDCGLGSCLAGSTPFFYPAPPNDNGLCLWSSSWCGVRVGCYRITQLTDAPTSSPSIAPTTVPSVSPTSPPTSVPSLPPSSSPTAAPSFGPTSIPSFVPTILPSASPSSVPTVAPSRYPTLSPTDEACLSNIYFISSPQLIAQTQCDGTLMQSGPPYPEFSCDPPDVTLEYNNNTEAWNITKGAATYLFPAPPTTTFPPLLRRQWTLEGTGPVDVVGTCIAAPISAFRVETAIEVNIRRLVTDSGPYIFVITVVGIVVALILAKLSESRQRGGDKLGGQIFALPLYFLQVLDILTDILFAVFLYARGELDLFIGSITFILLPWCIGVALLIKYILVDWASDELLRQWLKNYDKMLVLMFIPCGSFTRVVTLVNSKLFYSPTFDMGMRNRDLDRLARFRLIPILLENFPQLIIQIMFYVRADETTQVLLLAFCVTALSFVTSFLMGLVHFRARYAPYEMSDMFQHFFLQIDCSHPRKHYRCSRKNMSEAIARFIFDNKSPERVEVYEVDVDLPNKRIYIAGVIAWPGTQEEFDVKFNEKNRSLLATHIRNFLSLNSSVSASISGMSSEARELPRGKSIRSHMGFRATQSLTELAREEVQYQGGVVAARLKSASAFSDMTDDDGEEIHRASRRVDLV